MTYEDKVYLFCIVIPLGGLAFALAVLGLTVFAR